MDIERVFGKPKLLRALTSLDAGEFARLLAAFEQESQARRVEFNRFGQVRQRAPGATGNAGVLSSPKARLFFVLFYFKCYPLQEVMAKKSPAPVVRVDGCRLRLMSDASFVLQPRQTLIALRPISRQPVKHVYVLGADASFRF